MGLYFHKIDKYFPWFFIARSFGDEFRTIFGTSYPIFHRKSVTKGRLLTLLAMLLIVQVILAVISVNDFIISDQVHTLLISILFVPPTLFVNYKLFLVVRKSHKNRRISPEMKNTFSLKNISSCLLVVACVVVYIGLRINSPESTHTLDNANVAGIWAKTIALMNCTFNCLIFYWKNKVLRTRRIESSEKHENMSTGLLLAARITLLDARRKLCSMYFGILIFPYTAILYG